MGRLGIGLLLLLILGLQGVTQDNPFSRKRDKTKKSKSGPAKKEKAEPWENREKAIELVQEFAKAWADKAKKEELLQQAREIDEIPLSEIKRFLPIVHKALVAYGGKLKSGQFEHPDFPGRVIVSGSRGGLVLGLHGGGQGVGDGSTAAGRWGGVAGRLGIGIFPTVLQKRSSEWCNYDEEQEYCYELIKAAKRTFKVDSTQMYIMGFSMGGGGASWIGGQLADHFAAIMSGGSAAVPPLQSLMNTPYTFYQGELDTKFNKQYNYDAVEKYKQMQAQYGLFEHEFHEAKGVGHTWVPQTFQHQLDWTLKKKKELFPKKVLWRPYDKWKKVFYWLKMDSPAAYKGSGVFAEVSDNEVLVRGRATGLSVMLNDKLVDLSKEVVVRYNGSEVFRGVLKGSLRAILLSMDDKINPECALWAMVDLS